MKIGTVTSLRPGTVNDEVEVTLPSGTKIVAVVTRQSSQSLGLQPQATAIVILAVTS